MAKKKLNNKELLAEARKQPVHAKAVVVELDEIAKGMTGTCYPLRSEGLQDIIKALEGKDTISYEWRMVVSCYWEEDGTPLFTIDDIPFLEKFGYALKIKMATPAIAMSGLSGASELIKKIN